MTYCLLLLGCSHGQVKGRPHCVYIDCQALITYPVLSLPDFTKPFIVQSDACDHSIGCVLSQKDDNNYMNILYIMQVEH